MIKDWINNIYFDGESVLDQGSAASAPEVQVAASWNFIDGAGMQVWLEYVNPGSPSVAQDITCTIATAQKKQSCDVTAEAQTSSATLSVFFKEPTRYTARTHTVQKKQRTDATAHQRFLSRATTAQQWQNSSASASMTVASDEEIFAMLMAA